VTRRPFTAAALSLVALAGAAGAAHAVDRAAVTGFRRAAANSAMAYMGCRLDARAEIAAARKRMEAREPIDPDRGGKVAACVGKARDGVYAMGPSLNALISASPYDAGKLVKDWYVTSLTALDNLLVDVANLRDGQDATTDLQWRLDKAASALP